MGSLAHIWTSPLKHGPAVRAPQVQWEVDLFLHYIAPVCPLCSSWHCVKTEMRCRVRGGREKCPSSFILHVLLICMQIYIHRNTKQAPHPSKVTLGTKCHYSPHCGGGWRDEDLRREPSSTHSRFSPLSTLSLSSVPSQLPIQIKECVASSAHRLPIPTENRQEGKLRTCQSWPPREAAGLTWGTFFGNHSGSVREPTVT